jgi:hypothetical protein
MKAMSVIEKKRRARFRKAFALVTRIFGMANEHYQDRIQNALEDGFLAGRSKQSWKSFKKEWSTSQPLQPPKQ